MAHGLSMRAAIDRKCRDCIYDPLSGMGAWREQVEACTSPNCALFDLRPVTQATQRQKAENMRAAGLGGPMYQKRAFGAEILRTPTSTAHETPSDPFADPEFAQGYEQWLDERGE